ncbi:IS1380 family transposase, partial [Roseibium sp. RKSG952]|nr:IS1380 family transposase [Roseibium sp. RKSG952]
AGDLRTVMAMSRAMIDLCCDSYTTAPKSITLDIDDMFDAAHGGQKLTFWNGFHGARGFAPVHVYEAETGRPVAFVLRPA